MLFSRHRQHIDLRGIKQWHHHEGRSNEHVELPGDDLLHGICRTLVGDGSHFHASNLFKPLGHEVLRGPDPEMAVVELARVVFGILHEFAEGLGRKVL